MCLSLEGDESDGDQAKSEAGHAAAEESTPSPSIEVRHIYLSPSSRLIVRRWKENRDQANIEINDSDNDVDVAGGSIFLDG